MTKIAQQPYQEIIQLTDNDSFLIFDRTKETFDFPIHNHPEFELNFISNGKGLRRVVGDSMEEIGNNELVFVGPNINHCWDQYKSPKKIMHEITIQFSNSLFQKELLQRDILKPIKNMFDRSVYGILFSEETCLRLAPRISNVSKMDGLDYFLEIISILYDMSISRNQRILSTLSSSSESVIQSEKMERLANYVKKHYDTKITIQDVCNILNMSSGSFSRFIKKNTGKTFIDYLNDLRIGYASRYLIENDESISEIAYKCGFNSIANFNRRFKKIKGCTPTDYRNEFLGIRRIL